MDEPCVVHLLSAQPTFAAEPLDRRCKITAFEALRWKAETFNVMLEQGLEPDELVRIFEEPVPVF